MSVVAGYFSGSGQRLATEPLRELLEGYRIMPSEGGGDFLTDVRPIRFGHLVSKHRTDYRYRIPAVGDEDGNVLMISGFLFPPGASEVADAKRLLSLCVRTHGQVLEECEGEFVAIFVEGSSGTVHLVSDRFGACPFFLLEDGGRTYFSSNLALLGHLAGVRLESDALGWMQILLWDHTLGTRTHLRNVRRVLPASHLILSPAGTEPHHYWQLRSQVGEPGDPIETVHQLFDAFRSAMERRVRWLGKGMVALSSGMDSRLLAGALPPGADFSAWTFVDSVDVPETRRLRIASDVSRILGLPHTIKTIPRGVLTPAMARDIIALTGGLIGVHHSVKTMQGIAVMREAGVHAQMGGAPGGSLSGGYIRSLAYIDPTKTDECLKGFVGRMVGSKQAHLAASLFRRDTLREHYPQLTPSLMETLDVLDGPTAAHRVSLWKMANRVFGFHVVCPTLSHPVVTEAQPHLGYEYSDLLLRLPARWLYRAVFYRFMIFQCLPALRSVVYGNTGKPLSGTLDLEPDGSGPRSHYRRLRGFAGRSLRAISSARRRRQRFLYDLLSNTELLDEVAAIVRSHPSLGDILDVDKCTKFVTECRTGHVRGTVSDVAQRLGTLATMCYTAERFDRPEGPRIRASSPIAVI